MLNFKNKTVWITGGKRIGQVVADVFAKSGANIIVSYRNSKDEAEKVAKNAKKYGVKTLIVQCDVSSRESVKKAVKEIRKKFKKVDILVNMASVFTPVKFENINEKDWIENFNAHVLGTFWPTQILSKKDWQKIRKASPLKYLINNKEAVTQFAELVLYLSTVTMASGYVYPLDQGQNL